MASEGEGATEEELRIDSRNTESARLWQEKPCGEDQLLARCHQLIN